MPNEIFPPHLFLRLFLHCGNLFSAKYRNPLTVYLRNNANLEDDTMPFKFVYRTAKISALFRSLDSAGINISTSVHKYEWHSSSTINWNICPQLTFKKQYLVLNYILCSFSFSSRETYFYLMWRSWQCIKGKRALK